MAMPAWATKRMPTTVMRMTRVFVSISNILCFLMIAGPTIVTQGAQPAINGPPSPPPTQTWKQVLAIERRLWAGLRSAGACRLAE